MWNDKYITAMRSLDEKDVMNNGRVEIITVVGAKDPPDRTIRIVSG